MSNSSAELNALLRLLDDNDRRVAPVVDEKILAYGDSALAALQPFAEAGDEKPRLAVAGANIIGAFPARDRGDLG
jgi:hypothetical protein